MPSTANTFSHPTSPASADSLEVDKSPVGGWWHRLHLGAIFAHVVLSVLFTWPLALNFLPGRQNLVPGAMVVDRDQNLWNLWWVRHAILSGHNPFVTDFIWYPTPISLYYHTLNAFNGILAIPLLSVFTLPATYNIIVLFSFVMTGYGAFLLVHYVCGNKWAALVGSVVFAYSAYHIATMRGLLQLISLEWVPFAVLFLLMAVYSRCWHSRSDVGKWLLGRALPAGFFLLLVSLVDWYYTMYVLLLTALLGAYVFLRGLRLPRPLRLAAYWEMGLEPLARIALCIGVYLVLVSPILIPMFSELRVTNYMQPSSDASLKNSADLLAFFEPERGHKLWGQFFTNRDQWPFGDNLYEVYFTYTALILAGAGLFARRRSKSDELNAGVTNTNVQDDVGKTAPGKWFWAVCALIFFALALGPVLQINGNQISWLFTPDLQLWMPYRLVERLPLLNISRSPDRFDMPLTLCLAVLAGYGTNAVLSGWGHRFSFNVRGALVSLVIVALVFIELTPAPYVQRAAGIADWYYQLGKEPGDFSILELPPQDDYWHGAYRMYNQTAHGKRIFGGYISREFQHPFLTSTPGYQELTYLDKSDDIFTVSSDLWLSALAHYKTHYIVLQKRPLPEAEEPSVDISTSREAVQKVLGSIAVPVYSDDQLEAYRVPEPKELVAFMSLGDGWEPREIGEDGVAHRWMNTEATFRVDSPDVRTAFLVFKAASLGKAMPLEIYQGNTKVFDKPLTTGLQSYKVGPLAIPEGESILRLVSPKGTQSPLRLGQGNDPRELSFVFLSVGFEQVK